MKKPALGSAPREVQRGCQPPPPPSPSPLGKGQPEVGNEELARCILEFWVCWALAVTLGGQSPSDSSPVKWE